MDRENKVLIKKLEGFIRKYYFNRLIRGMIFSMLILLISFLIFSLLEYWGNFNTLIRGIFYYFFVATGLSVLIYYILIPVFNLLKIGKRLSYEDAAIIVGRHFPGVKDKILNTLQLEQMSQSTLQDTSLISASIEQKTAHLKPLDFKKVVNLKVNLKYAKYLLFPAGIFLLLLLYSPRLITEPTQRIIHHDKIFKPEFPFKLIIQNKQLDILQYDDFVLRVKAEGTAVPEHIYIAGGHEILPMQKRDNTHFEYRFDRLQKDVFFRLQAGEYRSEQYHLHVIPKPLLTQMEISLDYPAYTGKEDEDAGQSGNVLVPQGTKVQWKLYTKNVDSVGFRIGKSTLLPAKHEGNLFVFRKQVLKNTDYHLSFVNHFVDTLGSMDYSIRVVADTYPQISVEEYADSSLQQNLFFRCLIKDDYGFTKLRFVYERLNEQGEKIERQEIPLPINPQQNPQEIFYQYNFEELLREAGETVNYYFEVWDNDAIHGPKSTRSQTRSFHAPGKAELQKETDQTHEEIKKELQKMSRDAKALKKDIKKFAREIFDKKQLSWEDKQKMKELLQRQEELKKEAAALQQKSKKDRLKNEKFSETDKSLLEKQKKLEDILEELKKDDEIKNLLDELQKLMEKVKKEDVEKALEKMQLDTKDMEKMLDQNLELFKKLQLEMKMEKNQKKIEELAKKEAELSKETKQRKSDAQEQKAKQDQLNKEFEEWKKDMKEMEKLNQELERPEQIDTMEEQQKSTEEDMQKSSEQLQQNKKKKASKSQQSAAQKMKKMAEQMSAMMQANSESGAQESMGNLQQILDNLIHLSFAQEDLTSKTLHTSVNNPEYIRLTEKQKDIKTEFKIVNDSLTALGKRQPMISSFITKEVSKIESELQKSVKNLEDRNPQTAGFYQQSTMTSLNDLALMLSEVMQQMQNAMNASSCPNGGQAKPGAAPKPGNMQGLQQQLKDQLQQMKQAMKEGKGKDKGGKHQTMSEQFARMAAQQRALRQKMQEYAQKMEKEGQMGMAKELKRAAKDMNKTETELVNKMITAQSLIRQQEIITRLLKSEKAELQREKDKKRESKQGHNSKRTIKGKIHSLQKDRGNDEILRMIPPELKYFYKRKVNDYFYHFNNE